jgi:hypothetical protein
MCTRPLLQITAVRHLSEIHLWAVGHVARTAVTLQVDDVSNLVKAWPDLAVFWPTDDDLVGYYRDTNANLVHQLEAAPVTLLIFWRSVWSQLDPVQ